MDPWWEVAGGPEKSVVLIPVGFSSPETFLRLLKEALPTDLSGMFLNPSGHSGQAPLPSEGGPWRGMLKAEPFFSSLCPGLRDPPASGSATVTQHLPRPLLKSQRMLRACEVRGGGRRGAPGSAGTSGGGVQDLCFESVNVKWACLLTRPRLHFWDIS